jgi:hypothetical protein
LTTALADSQRSEGVAKEKFAKLQVRVRERLADLEHQIGAQTGGSNQQATTKEVCKIVSNYLFIIFF